MQKLGMQTNILYLNFFKKAGDGVGGDEAGRGEVEGQGGGGCTPRRFILQEPAEHGGSHPFFRLRLQEG